jgi:hypothetical protein
MATAAPFQPVNDQALWVPIYDKARTMDYGDLLTYEEITSLVDRDARVDRQPIYRAMKQLERHDHRTLIVDRNVGYRIALPEQHGVLMDQHRKRSYRQITKARRRATSAPRELLTPAEAHRLDEMDVRLSQHEMALRNINSRVDKLEHQDVKKTSKLDQIEAALEVLRQKGILD